MNLGLGLYFCRLAIESLGGRIWIEETVRLPTVFGIRLPRLGPPVVQSAALEPILRATTNMSVPS